MRTTCALGLACLALMTGCANFATLQTAETMRKENFEIGVGMTFTAYEATLETTTTSDASGNEITRTDSESITVPAVALAGRYGITDKLELHGVAWLPFGATVGGKYMLVGEHDQNGFIFSPGIDVSAPITISVDDEHAVLMDLYVPLHMGYRASDALEIYWTPKYLLRYFGGSFGHAPGGTVGFAAGRDTKFMLEGSVLYDTISQEPIFNVGVGVAFQ